MCCYTLISASLQANGLLPAGWGSCSRAGAQRDVGLELCSSGGCSLQQIWAVLGQRAQPQLCCSTLALCALHGCRLLP